MGLHLNSRWVSLALLVCCAVYPVAVAVLAVTQSKTPRVLVLGGTGFVGGNFIDRAIKKDFKIVSLSRRGTPTGTIPSDKVTWVKGDAVDAQVLSDVYAKYGPFDACVHAVGLLFDSQSGLKSLNQYASGSQSLADPDATYDRITRQTAFNAIDAFAQQAVNGSALGGPFLFVSAAEAGWTFDAPVDWLQRYLIAKRAVEGKLLAESGLRPVIFRPSLIWTWDKPAALFSVVPFYIGSKVGLPFVDRPVQVGTLVDAMIASVQDPSERGIKNFKDMDRLAARLK
jgi:nucleoside-diphosphate-sugar epimerase